MAMSDEEMGRLEKEVEGTERKQPEELNMHVFSTTEPASSPHRQAMGEAHRARTAKFVAPALVWHQAFWIAQNEPDKPSDAKPSQNQKERDDLETMRGKVKDSLDQFMISIFKLTKTSNHVIYPCIDGDILLYNNIVSSDDFTIISDYYTKDTLYDNKSTLNKNKLKSDKYSIFYDSDFRIITCQFEFKTNRPHNTKTERNATVCCEMHREHFTITVIIEITDVCDQDINNAIKSLSDYFGTQYDEHVEKSILSQIKKFFYIEFWEKITEKEFFSVACDEQIFKHVLTDFRGLIISGETFVIPYPRNDPHEKLDVVTWAAKIASKCVDIIHPIDISDHSRYECTMTYMLGGRALFMTAMGPQVPNIGQRSPVTYLMYVHQRLPDNRYIVNPWQLGRLIGRLHNIGDSRLAALRHLGALREVGRRLGRLDEAVSTALALIPEGNEKSKKAINEAHTAFREMKERFNKDTETTYGVSYAIERSRYYISLFKSGVSQLRLDRVEGFLQYDTFVEHRLGNTFEFLNRLGRRYGIAVDSLNLLDQYKLSITSNETASNLEKIQEWGEIALFGVLGPYYIVALIAYITSHQTAEIVGWFVWFCGIYLASRKYYNMDKPDVIKLSNGIKLRALCLAAIVIMSLFIIHRSIVPNIYNIATYIKQNIMHVTGGSIERKESEQTTPESSPSASSPQEKAVPSPAAPSPSQ
jgi:hypothetical protein